MELKSKLNSLLFLVMLVLMAGCQGRPAIQNPDLDHYHYGKFVNLHKPLYGYGYHQSELDELQYLNPSFAIHVIKMGEKWRMDGESGPQTVNLLK